MAVARMIGTALRVWVRRDEGEGLVELGLLLALFAAGVVALLVAMGGNLQTTFHKLSDCLVDPSLC